MNNKDEITEVLSVLWYLLFINREIDRNIFQIEIIIMKVPHKTTSAREVEDSAREDVEILFGTEHHHHAIYRRYMFACV